MILGINSYTHDVAVALVSGERAVLVLEEERFTRRKHQDGFVFGGDGPLASLAEATTGRTDIAHIAHSHALDYSAGSHNYPQLRFRAFAEQLDPDRSRTQYHGHHRCHASSTYYGSGFDQAYVCTLDSRGDCVAASVSMGTGSDLRLLYECPATSSPCSVYSHVTELLGLGRRCEGNLMALAGHGHRDDLFPDLFAWTGHGIHVGSSATVVDAVARCDSFQDKADVARSVQATFEAAVDGMLLSVCTDARIRKLALAGGGFLNCSLNQRLSQSARWDVVYTVPLAGDSGTALGAALLELDDPTRFRLEHVFLGSAYGPEEVKLTLEQLGLRPRKSSESEVAELLGTGQIGGFFVGAMEAGPRALGHRSIIADPRDVRSRERINHIKKRFPWQPVAPSILHEDGSSWIVGYEYSPFMTRSFQLIPGAEEEVPAIVHADRTARIQSVSKSDDPFRLVLEAFDALTGTPLVCNSSFNVNAPIVRTPAEAVACFYACPLDFLYIEGWLLTKA